ncbi:MAG: guanylate kinase [Candidatus Pelagibacter sp. TMED64]|nr:MAG: guanylate kinase [Candidatus Pelagibacter sp. TMED64]
MSIIRPVMGQLVVLSSPSGAGKTTLSKMLAKQNSNFVISISHTTRKPRPDEVDGKDYYFIDKKNFENLVKEKSFFEYASIFDNYYGTQKETVIKNLSNGKDVLLDIDWQGTQQLKKKIKNLKLVTIFILPPSIDILKQRLINRNQDGKKLADKRMKKFSEEISHWKEYDYVVVNDNIDSCYNLIISIINSEKNGIKFVYNDKEIKNTINKLIS